MLESLRKEQSCSVAGQPAHSTQLQLPRVIAGQKNSATAKPAVATHGQRLACPRHVRLAGTYSTISCMHALHTCSCLEQPLWQRLKAAAWLMSCLACPEQT